LASSIESLRQVPQAVTVTDPQFHGSTPLSTPTSINGKDKKRTPTYFSAQSYLRYQGEKFIKRFDANCYIAITRKLDTHDVSRNRIPSESTSSDPVKDALKMIEQPALILGIQSDGLFTYAEQQELAAEIPNAVLKTIDSSEGHDAFLLEFEQVNRFILDFMKSVLPDIMERSPVHFNGTESVEGDKPVKGSTVGEVDDITAW
jgi:homoserine O-acetyltransferase